MEYVLYADSLINNTKRIDSFLSKNKKISRLYFGEEFCEELIPDLAKIEDILQYVNRKDLDFTYVSGVVSDKVLKREVDILKFLNKQKVKNKKIEVVANDWGILSIIPEKFKNLKPILGRMLVKNQRMPRYTLRDPRPFSHLVANLELWDNQRRILRGSNLSIPEYRKFLKKHSIDRVELDVIPQGIEVDKKWGFKFSVYTPWSYVTGARTCDIAGLVHKDKSRYITDEPCSKPCRRFLIKAETGSEMLPLVQRGNSLFFNNSTLVSKFVREAMADRVILENIFI